MDSSLPTIRFTFSTHRIHISKAVLYAIGSPTHIQILISQDNRALYIRKCTTRVFDRFAVPSRVYTEGAFCFVMQKTAFAEAIGAFCGWESWGKYQLHGTRYTDRVMRFSLGDAERLDCDAEV